MDMLLCAFRSKLVRKKRHPVARTAAFLLKMVVNATSFTLPFLPAFPHHPQNIT